MPIIGTAGHVDHGKSTLVMALTGRDPDRWKEEKERGLTIDLGFAWTTIGGTEVGFVDVPGHERFIKNMLAGVGAIDVALFVVGADEGWMPQSEEHAGVLDLLGVRYGVVALTRVDLVDADLASLATLEIEDRLAGTSLATWPVVPVSAVSGEGIPSLIAALERALQDAGPPLDEGRPRIWVDRVFTIAGAGLVVTGTLVGGTLEVGDALEAWPQQATGRVRSLHRHDRAVERAEPGSRTAVNLVGLDRSPLTRGTLLATPGSVRATNRLLGSVRTVRGLDHPLGDRGAYRLHLGTGSWPVRLRLLDADAAPSRDSPVLLQIEGEVPTVMGDRFVLRDVGRRMIVAGGVVLDPAPGPDRTTIVRSVQVLREAVAGTADDRAAALLTVRGTASSAAITADSGGGVAHGGLAAGTAVVADAARDAHIDRLVAAVAAFHRENPLRPGIPKATLASASGLAPGLVEALIAVSKGRLVDEGPTVRTGDFGGGWGADEEEAWAAAKALLEEAGAAAPKSSELGFDAEMLHALLRDGRLVRVAADLVYLPEELERIEAVAAGFDDPFTVAQFRDALGVSRRHAVPLLEYLDGSGVTLRRGDLRLVRRPSGRDAGAAPPR